MRDTPFSHTHPMQAHNLIAAAHSVSPDSIAPLTTPAPIILGWRDSERLLYLECIGTAMRLMQWSSAGCEQLLSSQQWQYDVPELSLKQQSHLRAWLDAQGQHVYLQMHGNAWKIALSAASLTLEKVNALPQQLPQHGLGLQMLEPAQGLLCPNGRYVLHVTQDNLLLQDSETGVQRFLTLDGSAEFAYGTPLYFGAQIAADGSVARPLIASWSPDGRYILSYRLDYRRCHHRQLLCSHEDGSEQVWSWPEVMAGQEKGLPQVQLCLFDVQNERAIPILGPQFLFFDADYATEFFLKQITWCGDKLYFLPWARGRRAVDLFRADLATGHTEHVYTERSETNLDYPFFPEKCLPTARQIYWLSEQDGWSHLYELQEYGPPRQLTSGQWAVRAILGTDAQQQYLFFTASGREVGLDPYYRQLYRLHLQRGTIERLTPENADHEVVLVGDGSKFVDRYSRHDLPEQVIVRSLDGEESVALGGADFSRLYATGWRAPQAFSVKGRDGETDLHGLMILPPNLQENQQYPVVVSIYPGCHTVTVPKRLQVYANHIHFMQSLAQLGFIVLRLDSMGGPGRSKAFHDVLYRNLGDAGLQDQVLCLQQLASRIPQMDMQRVALLGSSAGGYATARGLMAYPHIFKVGVAAAGCHDLLQEGAEWTEDYAGWPIDEASYKLNSNSCNPHLIAQMQGRLLLLHGALDDNVSVTQSQRLAKELLKAGKDFEMLIVADGDHACIQRPDVQEHVWRFLLKYL